MTSPYTLSPTNNVALDEHVKHSVRVHQLNKISSDNKNRQEKYLPVLSQWLKKRVYCYIEPTMIFTDNQITYKARAGIQDLNGENIPYSQITFSGTAEGTRTAKVVRDQAKPAEISVVTNHLASWSGYAHFILPNREICVLNFERPA